MIRQFIDTCEKKSENIAFISGNKRISFQTLRSDIYRMVNLLSARGVTRGSKALLYLLPSYDFYVLMLACIYHGVHIIAPDSYQDKGRILRIIQAENISHVFCNSLTGLLHRGIKKQTPFINVAAFRRYTDEITPADKETERIVLTTFTSGTTGEPKPIRRSKASLKMQIESISNNLPTQDCKVAFGSLPIYVLYAVYHGNTCMIGRSLRKNQLKKYRVDTLFAPIATLLKGKGEFKGVRKVYCGGARLYAREAKKLQKLFPNAEIFYNYGASECALIAMTELKYYIKHGFAMERTAADITTALAETDENGVGKIVVKGAGVLTENHEYHSNDLGCFDKWGLHIVGRSKYSACGRYNYLLDDEILSKNDRIKKGFSFVYGDRTYFCYEGTASEKKEGVLFVKFKKLPMDAKHKTKLDYHKTVEILREKKLL